MAAALVLTVSLSGQGLPSDWSSSETGPGGGQEGGSVPSGSPEIDLFVQPLDLQQEVAVSNGARPLLAQAMARAARRSLSRAKPELIHVELAYALSGWATELDKNSLECWRLRLAIAAASDPDDPGVRAAEVEALQRISTLDPSDTVVRLRRILLAIEQVQTVELRLKRFEQLLEPESIEVLGRDVAARLAMDMALLLSRTGDSEGFARRLAQALELDPFFPRATAMAAGYFADGDPVNEAELLVAALLADPLEIGFASQLGRLALENGAYKPASRMLGLAYSVARTNKQSSDELAIQYAMSLWGDGRSDLALEVLSTRMRDLDATMRIKARQEDPGMAPSKVIEITADEPPRISMLKGAILSEGSDDQAYRQYVAGVIKRLAALFSQPPALLTDDADDAEVIEQDRLDQIEATLLLEAAAFIAWHGEDPAQIIRFVEEAGGKVDLDPSARQRFTAWADLARDDIDAAIATLALLADEDELAAVALSIAYARSGRTSDAARIWLRLARSAPGTAIGIWSMNRLENTLGTRVAATETAKLIAERIDEIPASFDRILLERDAAYSLSLKPVQVTVPPFGGIRYEAEILNRSGLRLSIGSDGPLLPTMGMVPTVTLSRGTNSTQSRSMVTSIDRRLGVDPRESLKILYDLNYYPVSELAITRAGEGLAVDTRAVTNFTSDGSMIVPDRFGESVTSILLRVDGVTPDAPYRRDAMKLIAAMNGIESLNALLILLDVSLRVEPGQEVEESRVFRSGIISIFLARYDQLPAHARAWLAYAVPLSSTFDEYQKLLNVIANDTSPVVQKALLAKMTWAAQDGGSQNVWVLRLMQSEDPEVVEMATKLQSIWAIAELEESAAESANSSGLFSE
jgi:hypothetical protein